MTSFERKVVWFSVGLVIGNHNFDSKLKLQFTHTLFSLMPPSLPGYCCGSKRASFFGTFWIFIVVAMFSRRSKGCGF